MAGRFLDHVPAEGRSAIATERAVVAMREAGYMVDDELWASAGTADCTGCGNGCHDDPPPAGDQA